MITLEASSKIAGYLFQFQRALYILFSSNKNNPIVGIETADDIAEMWLDDSGKLTIRLEQDKHSTDMTANLLQDSSKNLWHSFHIWLDSFEDINNNYEEVRYAIVTNNSIKEGTLAYKLSNAKSEEDINACLTMMKGILSKGEENKGNFDKIKNVLAYDEEKIKHIIRNLEISGNGGVENNLKSSTINLFNLPSDIINKSDEIYLSLFGFIVDSAYTKWKNKEVFWIEKNTLSNRLFNECKKMRSSKYLEQSILSTNYKKHLQESDNNHIFLKQLNALNLSNDFCNLALKHYWGFYSEKVRLEEEGEILPSDWDDRDSNLHERWRLIVDKKSMDSDENDVNYYKDIIKETLDNNYCAPLAKQATSQIYFTLGNYHYLANDNQSIFYIFWHPFFTKTKDQGD